MVSDTENAVWKSTEPQVKYKCSSTNAVPIRSTPQSAAHRVTRTLVALVVVAACSAPAGAEPGAGAGQTFRPLSALFFLPPYAPPASGEVALVPDSKIAWDLRVVARSLGLTEVEITVNKQAVRLRGPVPTEEARATLVRIADSARGVKSVTDTLEVRP